MSTEQNSRWANLGRAATELVCGPREAKADSRSSIVDVVTDLHHYADCVGVSWDDVMRISGDHFAAEHREGCCTTSQRRHKWICAECGSDRVTSDAIAKYDENSQDWVIVELLENEYCLACEHETSLHEIDIDDAQENDRCRVCGKIVPGCCGECGCDAD